MSELPLNWTLARVGDLVELGPKNDCPDNTEVGFVPLQRLGMDYRSRHTFELKPWSAVKKGYTHFADGDVLLARITPSFENGKAGIVRGLPNGIGAGSTEYFVCRPIKGALLPEYLLAHFKTPQFLRDGRQVMSGAVGQQRVPKQYVLDSELPLAPFNEQKRIADKLDAVLARVDACRERLDRVPAILRRFRQAVLATATSGALTEEWREERNKDSSTWEATSVGSLIQGVEAGINIQCEERPPEPNERGLVKISAVTWGVYNDNESKTLPPTRQVPEATRIVVGDFLLSRANTLELVGACVLVEKVTRPVYLSDKVLRLVMSEEYKKWLLFWLRSQNGRKQIEQLASGNQLSMRNLSQANLKAIAVRLPPSDERAEIVRRVEALLGYADQLEAHYTAARAKVERLTPALLAKAFRGELVPQDPNDEPAAVLLERIRAARATSEGPTGPKRRKGGGGPKTSQKAGVLMLTRKDVQDTHLTTILKERGPLTAEALWSASQLGIDDFYDQLKDEEARGLLREKRGDSSNAPRTLEAA
jgi:type I restriction enzyme S subunit